MTNLQASIAGKGLDKKLKDLLQAIGTDRPHDVNVVDGDAGEWVRQAGNHHMLSRLRDSLKVVSKGRQGGGRT